MEDIVYWIINVIRYNRKIDVNTLLMSVISTMNLDICKHDDGLWYGEYDGLYEGVSDESIMDWIMGYMSAFYEF